MSDADLDRFMRAYIECALWSSMDESTPQGGEPMDKNYTIDDIAEDTLKDIKDDCRSFLADQWCDIKDRLEQSGHDFWLTRNHHGAGFWGRGLGKLGEKLTEAAHSYGSYDLYVGDDGLVHGQ